MYLYLFWPKIQVFCKFEQPISPVVFALYLCQHINDIRTNVNCLTTVAQGTLVKTITLISQYIWYII